MFKVYHKKVSDLFQSLFSRYTEIHTYSTRHQFHYQLPKVRCEYTKQSIKHNGALLWNKIMENGISPNISIPKFKRAKYRCNLRAVTFCVSLSDIILSIS